MAAVTICSDFGAPPQKKSNTVSNVSPSITHEAMGPDAISDISRLNSRDDCYSLYILPLEELLASEVHVSSLSIKWRQNSPPVSSTGMGEKI